MKNTQRNFCIAFFGLILFSCKKEDTEIKMTVFKSSGDINAQLNAFRSVLGALNTTPGSTTGRREVNWDTVADSMLNKNLPNDFFNATGPGAPVARQRGLVYEGGAVQVSSSGFDHINSQAATEFASFSGGKSFANVNSKLWEIGFQLAGQSIAASVKGFGMVFTDVDKENTTSLEFFDGDDSLGKFFVPAHNAASVFSFLAVHFDNRKITRVKVSHQGTLSAGEKDISQGGLNDLIVMDDVVYSEPVK